MTRSLLVAAGLSLAIALGSATSLQAQDQTVPATENAKSNFPGVVNANAVYVRSGPGENFYPTMKLDKGAKVTVVGINFDWLKVVPPDGSFSYVPKVYVERHGDGSVGKVTKDAVNVRAGSNLVPLIVTFQMQLNRGEEVQILGEHNEYYKVKPPQGVYAYIHKQFVDPVLEGQAIAPPADDGPVPFQSEPIQRTTETAENAPAPRPSAEQLNVDSPSPATRKTEEAAVPTTQETQANSAEVQFDQTEAEFQAASSKPLDQQPVADMLKAYEGLASNDQLPETLRRVCDARVIVLKQRAEALELLSSVKKSQEQLKERQKTLVAEQEELQQRMAETGVTIYAAVGKLQTSSLQQGQGTLYRLTDPDTNRTICYVRTNDAKYPGFIGQFVGIKGSVTSDSALKMKLVIPSEIAAVDPAKVHNGVVAEIVPPSIIAKRAAEASAQEK